MLSAPFDVFRLDIRAFGLGVDHDQQHNLVSYQVEVDDARTSALTGPLALPTHLARTVSTRDHVAGIRVLGDEVDERLALLSGSDCVGLLLERRSFNHGAHFYVYTQINMGVKSLSQSLSRG
jgi:hypothetical protein